MFEEELNIFDEVDDDDDAELDNKELKKKYLN